MQLLGEASRVESINALPCGASLVVPDGSGDDGAWLLIPMEGVSDPTSIYLALSMLGYYVDDYEDVQYVGDYTLARCFMFEDE